MALTAEQKRMLQSAGWTATQIKSIESAPANSELGRIRAQLVAPAAQPGRGGTVPTPRPPQLSNQEYYRTQPGRGGSVMSNTDYYRSQPGRGGTAKGPDTRSTAVIATPPPEPTPTTDDSGARAAAAAAAAQARAAQEARDAQARAEAEAAAAMARAGARFQSQASNLDPQIAALRHALDTTFAQSRDQNLGDIDTLLQEQFDLLKKGSSERALEFLAGAKNTQMAKAEQAESSLSNLVRERQDSLSAVLEHGAGQTDMLRAMVSAARNWHSNAQEGNRAYFDSMQSTNAAINDLNVDTQTALSNTHNQTESERERLWQDFYNRRSETFTQLGNVYTQQADYLDLAKEQKVGGGGKDKANLAGTAFMDASKEAGQSYARQRIPDWIKDYKGQEKVKARVSNSDLAAAMTFQPLGNAEGASLRKWA